MKLADTGLSQLADTLIIERTIRMLSYAVPYLHTTLCADCMQALPLPKATNKTDCLSSQPDISVDAVCARIKSIKVSQMTPLNAALLSSKVSKLLRCVRVSIFVLEGFASTSLLHKAYEVCFKRMNIN